MKPRYFQRKLAACFTRVQLNRIAKARVRRAAVYTVQGAKT